MLFHKYSSDFPAIARLNLLMIEPPNSMSALAKDSEFMQGKQGSVILL